TASGTYVGTAAPAPGTSVPTHAARHAGATEQPPPAVAGPGADASHRQPAGDAVTRLQHIVGRARPGDPPRQPDPARPAPQGPARRGRTGGAGGRQPSRAGDLAVALTPETHSKASARGRASYRSGSHPPRPVGGAPSRRTQAKGLPPTHINLALPSSSAAPPGLTASPRHLVPFPSPGVYARMSDLHQRNRSCYVLLPCCYPLPWPSPFTPKASSPACGTSRCRVASPWSIWATVPSRRRCATRASRHW